MPAPAGLRFRAAGPGDAKAIAGLHADSWQRHYQAPSPTPSSTMTSPGTSCPSGPNASPARTRGPGSRPFGTKKFFSPNGPWLTRLHRRDTRGDDQL